MCTVFTIVTVLDIEVNDTVGCRKNRERSNYKEEIDSLYGILEQCRIRKPIRFSTSMIHKPQEKGVKSADLSNFYPEGSISVRQMSSA